jgi:hypothetical protein
LNKAVSADVFCKGDDAGLIDHLSWIEVRDMQVSEGDFLKGDGDV